jgi:hypothetical protein
MPEGLIPSPHGSNDQETLANQFQTSNLSSRPKPYLGRVCMITLQSASHLFCFCDSV